MAPSRRIAQFHARRDLGDVAVTALTRPGAASALLAAAGVYLVLVLQNVLSTVAFVATDVAYGQDVPAYLGPILRASAPTMFGAPVPFVVGVFLSFWQLAPVAPQLRMAHVVTRSLLAVVLGALATGMAGFVAALAAKVLAGGRIQGLADGMVEATRAGLSPAFSLLISGVAVVPLAALLLWGWQRSHPPATTPAGALDEV